MRHIAARPCPLSPSENKVYETIKIFCKSYQAIYRRLRFTIMPAVDRFFEKSSPFFQSVFSNSGHTCFHKKI